MKPKFKHFIIIKFDYPEQYKFFDTKLQQLRWTCLESLRKQTNKEFVLVFCSSHPMPHEGFGEIIISNVWKDKVRESAKDYEYIITTRLDGDDFVAPNFVEEIQKNFEPKDNLVMDYNGWVYDYRNKKAVLKKYFKNTTLNCLSFIEKTDSIDTCYIWGHNEMGKKFKVKWIDKKIHIWCINLESLRSCSRAVGFFTDGGEDKLQEIKNLDTYYPLLVDRVNVFNDKINKDKLLNG